MRRVVLVSAASLCAVLLAGCVPPVMATGDARVESGAQMHQEGRFLEAIDELKLALDEPLRVYSRSYVLTMIGNCYYESSQYEEALSYHDQSIAEDPANHMAYVNRGIVYRELQEYDKAEESYLKAVELEPDYPEAYASLGVLDIARGDYEAAVLHLERGIELDGSLSVTHANIAVAYAGVGRFDDAENHLARAVTLGYQSGEVIRQLIDEQRLSHQDAERADTGPAN